MSKKKRGKDSDTKADFSPERVEALIEKGDLKLASELLFLKLESEPTDNARRAFLDCARRLESPDFRQMAQVTEAIENKTWRDFSNLAIARYCLDEFDAAEEAINKRLLLQDGAWAHYFKTCILKQGRSYWQRDDLIKKRATEELTTAVGLPDCPEAAFLDLFELSPPEKGIVVLEGALTIYPHYNEIRVRLSSRYLQLNEAEKALAALDPLLPKNEPASLCLAVNAMAQLKQPERALQLLERLPEAARKEVGFSKIRGDFLFVLGRTLESITEFEREIASSHTRAQIIGLFSRAHVHFKSKAYAEALRDAKNALSLCFDHGEFDFTSEPFWFPHYQNYEYRDSVLQVCKALDINDAKILEQCEDVTRWEARFLEWAQNYFIAGIDAADHRLGEFEIHLPHPYVSRVLAELYQEKGNLLEAIRHHFVYNRWKFSKLKAEYRKTFLSLFYFDEQKLPKKTEGQKIHRLIKAELQACTTAEEITQLLVPFYRDVWRAVLEKYQLHAEARIITDSLLKFAPDDTDLLWDFAYAHGRSDSPETAERSEWGYQELLKRLPNSPAAYYNLSLLLERNGRMSEASEMMERAYNLNPKDADFIARHNKFVAWNIEYKKQREKIEIAKRSAAQCLSTPVPFESLTLRQRLYLSALLRCSLAEDQSQILSIEESSGKLTPSGEHTDRVLAHLWRTNIIVVDPSSKLGSYLISERGTLDIYTTQVRWNVNVASTKGLTRAAILAQLCEPEEVADHEIDQAIELWREVALEESLEYLQHKRRAVNLFAEIGEKTRESFNELLNWFSTAQIYSIVWNVVPKALAGLEEGKFSGRTHAANSIPGRCKSYGEQAYIRKWNLSRYRRDFECEQSIISELLFNRYLMVGQLGFDNRPGDFSAVVLPTRAKAGEGAGESLVTGEEPRVS